MRIIFVGPPGAGKGTQCERLLQYLRIPHISTGDMLRQAISHGTQEGKNVQHYMSKGQLVPDNVILALIKKRLNNPDCDAGALFDGFPRTLPQAEALSELLIEHGTPLDVVLELRVPDSEVIKRLTSRGRDDDRTDVVAERLKAYWKQTRPLLDYYGAQGLVEVIDGQGAPAEVFQRIQGKLAAPRRV